MKNTVRMIALVFFVGINARCENVGQCPEFDKFDQHYGLSSAGLMGQKIQDCQRNPDCFGQLKDRSYGSISALPGIYMKGSDVPRVINALRMQNCIERHNLYLLGVAPKCLGKVDGQWRVFAQEIASAGTHISLELIKQLVILTKETGFRDWNRNWLWNSAQNKLICIDTEDDSFLIGMYRGVEGMDIPNHCLFNYVASLMIWRNSMGPEAGDWFDETLNELLNDPKALEANIPLPQNTKYDDLAKGIDFQKVKKEYSGW